MSDNACLQQLSVANVIFVVTREEGSIELCQLFDAWLLLV
jgi:hypothetical protein